MTKKKLTKKQKDRRETIEAIVGGILMVVFMVELIYLCAILEALYC